MFYRFLLLILLVGCIAGCGKKDPLTEDQKRIRKELLDAGVVIHGNEILDVDMKGSDKVTPELMKTIVSYGKISYLNFSGSNISDKEMEILKDAESLLTLHIDDTEVTDAGLKHLVDVPGIIILHLPTTIGDEGFEHIGKLTSLRTLTAEECQVTDAGMAHLENLTDLRWLKLNKTAIGDKGLYALKDLTNLHTIEIQSTKITDRGLLALSGLSGLNTLLISGCDVSLEAAEELKKEMPGAEIDILME